MTAVIQLGNSNTYYYVYTEKYKDRTSEPTYDDYQMDFGIHMEDNRPLDDFDVNKPTCPFEEFSTHEFLQYLGTDKVLIKRGPITYTANECLSLTLYIIVSRIRAKHPEKLHFLFIIDPNWASNAIQALQNCIKDNEISDYKIVYSDEMINHFLYNYLKSQSIKDEKHTLIINSGTTGTNVFISKVDMKNNKYEILKRGYIHIGHMHFTKILYDILLGQLDFQDDNTKAVIDELKSEEGKYPATKRCLFNEVSKLSQTMIPNLTSKLTAVTLNRANFQNDTLAFNDVIVKKEYIKLETDLINFLKDYIDPNNKIDYYTTLGGNSLNPFFQEILKKAFATISQGKVPQELSLNNVKCSQLSGALDLLEHNFEFKTDSNQIVQTGQTSDNIKEQPKPSTSINKKYTKDAKKLYETNKNLDNYLNQFDSLSNFKNYCDLIDQTAPKPGFLKEFARIEFESLPPQVLKEKLDYAVNQIFEWTKNNYFEKKDEFTKKTIDDAIRKARDALDNNQKPEMLSCLNIFIPGKERERRMENFKSKDPKTLFNEFCDYLNELKQLKAPLPSHTN